MKKIFVSPNTPEVELFANVLGQAGVTCGVMREYISETMDFVPDNPELWVADDQDVPKAMEFLSPLRESAEAAKVDWICPGCGETLAKEFDTCWKCGAQRSAQQ